MNLSEKPNQGLVCLLQSGGRDSTAAAISLLESGNRVVAVTLAENAASQVELPNRRALELANIYEN